MSLSAPIVRYEAGLMSSGLYTRLAIRIAVIGLAVWGLCTSMLVVLYRAILRSDRAPLFR
jgi:hypothetical protein